MNKISIRSVAQWVCAATIGVTTSVSAESVGANFLGRNAPTTLLPNERAGLVEQAFWNNIDDAATGESGTSDTLRNDSGNFTAAKVSFKGNDSWNSDGPSVTPNDRLMLGTIKQQGKGTSGTFSLNNLGAGPYDVILYVAMNADGVNGEFTVGGVAKSFISIHQFDGTFVEATDSTAGSYVRFNGVTPVSGKIDIAMKYINGGDGVGLAGIQAIGTFPANTTPVSIVTQPKKATVPVGSRAGFSVKANAANLNFQWYRNNAIIPGATSASYTTPVTTAADNGAKYKVTVGNNVNTVTSDEVILEALTPVLAKGFVTAEFYHGINGTAVADLQNSDKFKAGAADANRLLAAIDTPGNYGDNYGAKVSGFFTPPADGNYYFFVRSDDASALYISSDDKVANLGADPIAFETGCCDAFKEPGSGDETSAAIALQKNHAYYFEALVKEGGGGDYLQIAVKEENDTTAASALKPVGGDWIGTYVLPDSTITVVTAPVATQVSELSPAQFSAAATATSATRGAVPVRYQWLKNGNPIPGATDPILKISGSVLSDSGTKYSVRIGAPGAADVTTAQVALTVVPDNVPPAILSVAALNSKANGIEVSVLVDEPLTEAGSLTLSNFKLSAGTVTAARYIENSSGKESRERAIILNTTGLSGGSSYTLTVSGLKDIKGNTSSSVATPFSVSKLTWVDLARPSAYQQDVVATKDGFNVLNGGAAFWGTDDDATFVYEEVTGDFDKVLRIEGQDASSNWARAGLTARVSLDAHGDTASRYQNVHANPYPKKFDGTDSNQGFETNRRLTVGGATSSSNGDNGANHPAYPNAWVRLIRTGDVMRMYRSNDGITWFSLGRTDFNPADGSGEALPAKLFVGPVFGSENGNINPEDARSSWNAQFRNYGDYVSTAAAGKQTYSIGVNFTDDNRDGALGPADVAGADASAQKNWNNGSGTTTGDVPLVVKADEGGVAKTTTTTVEWSGVPNTWASTGRGEENNKLTGPNHLLMSGFLDTTSDSTTQIKVSGIPAKLTSGKYDVVVYTLGGVASGRGGAFRVTDADGNQLKPYVFVTSAENPTSLTRVPAKESTPGDGATYATGSYVVFAGLSSPNIIIEATTQIVNINGTDVDVGVGGTQRAPVNAIQLVSPSGLFDQVAVNPTISIQGNKVTFTGTLQSADNVSGPYTDVAGATSPLTINPNAAQKFWRTRQ